MKSNSTNVVAKSFRSAIEWHTHKTKTCSAPKKTFLYLTLKVFLSTKRLRKKRIHFLKWSKSVCNAIHKAIERFGHRGNGNKKIEKYRCGLAECRCVRRARHSVSLISSSSINCALAFQARIFLCEINGALGELSCRLKKTMIFFAHSISLLLGRYSRGIQWIWACVRSTLANFIERSSGWCECV